jgi:hypothetical protein
VSAPTLRRSRDRLGGTDGNELLTGTTAGVLIALLLAEGVTIVFMGGLRVEHMFVGLVLIPPVLLKLASTGYRFARYYTGSRPYREKGPPVIGLRLLAPVLVATTLLVFGTGVALLLVGHRAGILLELHKVAFIVWGACFAVHVLWHLPRAWRAMSSTWRGTGAPGSALRGMVLSASIAGGLALALVLLSTIESWHRGHG